MTPGSVVRLRWVVKHPAGRAYLRDEIVVIEAMDDDELCFEWLDGFGSGWVVMGDVLTVDPVEVDA